jgi:hypothetical protein
MLKFSKIKVIKMILRFKNSQKYKNFNYNNSSNKIIKFNKIKLIKINQQNKIILQIKNKNNLKKTNNKILIIIQIKILIKKIMFYLAE